MLSYTWPTFPGFWLAGRRGVSTRAEPATMPPRMAAPWTTGAHRGWRDCGNPSSEESPEQESQAGADCCHEQMAEKSPGQPQRSAHLRRFLIAARRAVP